MTGESRVFSECEYSEKQLQFESHFHNAYELVYACEGTVRFTISESCYDADPDTALFISKLEEHNLKITDGFYRRFYILLTPAQLNKSINDPKLRSVFISRPKGFRHAFDLSESAYEAQALLNAIRAEYANSKEY